jgi:hypothetical protein
LGSGQPNEATQCQKAEREKQRGQDRQQGCHGFKGFRCVQSPKTESETGFSAIPAEIFWKVTHKAPRLRPAPSINNRPTRNYDKMEPPNKQCPKYNRTLISLRTVNVPKGTLAAVHRAGRRFAAFYWKTEEASYQWSIA